MQSNKSPKNIIIIATIRKRLNAKRKANILFSSFEYVSISFFIRFALISVTYGFQHQTAFWHIHSTVFHLVFFKQHNVFLFLTIFSLLISRRRKSNKLMYNIPMRKVKKNRNENICMKRTSNILTDLK